MQDWTAKHPPIHMKDVRCKIEHQYPHPIHSPPKQIGSLSLSEPGCYKSFDQASQKLLSSLKSPDDDKIHLWWSFTVRPAPCPDYWSKLSIMHQFLPDDGSDRWRRSIELSALLKILKRQHFDRGDFFLSQERSCKSGAFYRQWLNANGAPPILQKTPLN